MNVEYLDLINKLYKINNTNSEVYIKYLANLTENYIKKNEYSNKYEQKYHLLKIIYHLFSKEDIFFNFKCLSQTINFIFVTLTLVFKDEDIEFIRIFVKKIYIILENNRKSLSEFPELNKFVNELIQNRYARDLLIEFLPKNDSIQYLYQNFEEINFNSQSVHSLSETFISFDRFKEKIDANNNIEEINKYYRQLVKESERIYKLLELDDNKINLNILYEQDKLFLVLFKSLLHHLDKGIKNDNIRKLFCRLIFRSDLFIQFMKNNLRESQNYYFNTNIENNSSNLYKIGYYVIHHINKVKQSYLDHYKHISEKISRKFIAIIKEILDDLMKSDKFKYLNYKLQDSLWNGNICSLIFTEDGRFEFNETLINLSLYNVSKTEKIEIINTINEKFNNVSEVNTIRFDEEELSIYLTLKFDESDYYLIISVNSVNFLRLNIIKDYFSLHPLTSIVFNAVKYWAVRRNLITTPMNYNSRPNTSVFNVIQLGILVVFFMIQIGFLPKLNSKNDKNLKIEYYINSFTKGSLKLKEMLFYCEFMKNNKGKYDKPDFKDIFNIGYLYTSFFYFMLSLLDASKEKCVFIDLREDSILYKYKEDKYLSSIMNKHLVIIDFFNFLKKKDQILNCISDLDEICKYIMEENKNSNLRFNNISEIDDNEDERKVICDLTSENIDKLRKEVCRFLHYSSFEFEEFHKNFIYNFD